MPAFACPPEAIRPLRRSLLEARRGRLEAIGSRPTSAGRAYPLNSTTRVDVDDAESRPAASPGTGDSRRSAGSRDAACCPAPHSNATAPIRSRSCVAIDLGHAPQQVLAPSVLVHRSPSRLEPRHVGLERACFSTRWYTRRARDRAQQLGEALLEHPVAEREHPQMNLSLRISSSPCGDELFQEPRRLPLTSRTSLTSLLGREITREAALAPLVAEQHDRVGGTR